MILCKKRYQDMKAKQLQMADRPVPGLNNVVDGNC